MHPPRFNRHYKEKKCPICQKWTGSLYAQPGPLKALGYKFGHYAHIHCVVAAREAALAPAAQAEAQA